MENHDTVELLKECNAGIKMAVSSIDEVFDHVKDAKLRHTLSACKHAHEEIGNQTHSYLDDLGTDGKDPNPMAKAMSWLKTNVMTAMDDSDATVADLMTDGCNMGIKSLRKYNNQYERDDKKAKDIARHLIDLECHLVEDLAVYL